VSPLSQLVPVTYGNEQKACKSQKFIRSMVKKLGNINGIEKGRKPKLKTKG